MFPPQLVALPQPVPRGQQPDVGDVDQAAPGQDVDEIVPVVERLLREAAPEGADLTVDLWASSQPGLVSPDAPAIQLGLEAFERALGTRPALAASLASTSIVTGLPASVSMTSSLRTAEVLVTLIETCAGLETALASSAMV